MLKAYLKQIADTSIRGDAREESYYPVLKDLFYEYSNSVGKKKTHITVLPKQTEAGNPDFRVWDGKQHITGYIETYRTKYAEFLKIDFPRVPFTKDYRLFEEMSEHGNRLVNLHLLKSQELDLPIARFQGKGDNRVEKPRYDDKAGRVYINKEQYFEGILQAVWRYQIGGYQVLR